MSMVATDIKGLFKISIKARHDSYSDQYNRIFMMKLLLACTVVTGISWYNDKFTCIVPETQATYEDFGKFVGTTCWVQGVYIYKEMHDRLDHSSYYGIPNVIAENGLIDGKIPCQAKQGGKCVEMTKKFFYQYQIMPFYLAALAMLYFVPYMIHKTINHDLINLREEIKKDEKDIDGIVQHYFKERKRDGNPSRLTVRQVMNVLVKIGYILVNFIVFFGTDSLLDGKFYSYGGNWLKWMKQNNTVQFNYMGFRDSPKPGNELLPPFGYCEMSSQAKEKKMIYNDHHKVVCELSQHILYQYTFIIIWFAVVIGIVASFIGLIILVINYVIGIVGINRLRSNDPRSKKLFSSLTYREVEYLEFMRKKDQTVYGEVLDKLRERILGSPAESVGSSYDHPPKSDYPMYPIKRKGGGGPYAL